MKLLQDKILRCGKILPGDILKVDSFINHQIDVNLGNEMGREFYRLYSDCNVTKILTIEASGIGIACLTALHFNVPVVFAKKSKSKNTSDDFYSVPISSYTHGSTYDVTVSKEYLSSDDNILIIDDFLALGNALKGLWDICNQAGANVVGSGIIIEKSYQNGGNELRKNGMRIESLAKIKSMNSGNIIFE